MQRFSFRNYALSVVIALCVWGLLPLVAIGQHNDSSDKMSTKKDTAADNEGRYQGTIEKPERNTNGSSSAPPPQQIFLRADMKSHQGGLTSTIVPYYTEKSGLTGEEFNKLASSPLVSSRVAKWRTWYSKVFNEIASSGKIPDDLAMKVNVSIDKHGKVEANTEWMSPVNGGSSKLYSEKFIDKIRALGSKPWISFPEKSYLEMVSFDIYLTYGHEFQLGNGVQPIDYD